MLRGATDKAVYDSARLSDMAPTRLFVDAETTAEWRGKGFFPVLNEQGGPLENNLEASLLYNMIRLGREQPLPPHSAVPEHIQLGLQRKNECPLPAEFDSYAQKKPLQGMPLAITGLSDSEYGTLRQWIREGAIIDEQPSPPMQNEYIRLRRRYYRDSRPQGPSLQDIWDGDGAKTNAALTAFRHFDNATVVKGFVGAVEGRQHL